MMQKGESQSINMEEMYMPKETRIIGEDIQILIHEIMEKMEKQSK